MARPRRTVLSSLRRLHILRGMPACAVAAVLLGSTVAHARGPNPAQPQSPTPDQASSPTQSSASLPDAPSAPGRVLGSVIDSNGNPITGALIALAPDSGPNPAPVTTAEDGFFAFSQIAPGSFTLTVTLSGFAPATATGTLTAGQSDTLAPITLHLVAASTVEAVDAHELAAQQIHIEEQQRLIGVLPNFFVSYNWVTPPLSTGQKFSLSFRSIIDPGTFIVSAGLAGVQQANNDYPSWGQGAGAYGKRFAANTGDVVTGTLIGGAILPSLFRQDPRYFYKGTGSIRSRIVYAITRSVIARGDNGKWQPAYASVLGDFSAGAISNLYYPAASRQGALLTIENGFIGVAGDAFNGIMQEFVLRHVTPGTHKPPTNQP